MLLENKQASAKREPRKYRIFNGFLFKTNTFFSFFKYEKDCTVLNKYLYYTYMYLNTKDSNYFKLAL